MNYSELENKVTQNNDSWFVVRDTDHPIEDLKRNWSTFLGGVHPSTGDFAYDTEEQAIEADKSWHQEEEAKDEYRYHPAHEGFCLVHYEGLGAFQLEAESIKEAIKEAKELSNNNDLAVTSEAGDGHFYANQVISFRKVREGRYIFEIV